MSAALSLSDAVKTVSPEELDAAQKWLSEQFQLFETKESANEEGQTVRYRARTDKWTPEIATIYQLLIATQAYKLVHEAKQLSMFDLMTKGDK